MKKAPIMNSLRTLTWLILLVGCLAAAPAFAEGESPAKASGDAKQAEIKPKDAEAAKEVAYLGVGTQPVPEEVRAQVDLPRHAGLSVLTVIPKSPAAAAGLTNHDVLTKIDDQWVFNAAQLQALVRMHDPGDQITLTFLRKGKTHQAKVTLAGRAADERGTILGRFLGNGDHVVISVPSYPHLRERYQKLLDDLEKSLPDAEEIKQKAGKVSDDLQQRIDKLQERIHQLQREMGFESDDAGQPAAQANPAPPRQRVMTASQLVMRKSDDQHRITLTVRDEVDKHLHVEDKQGKVIFDGLINTPEERQDVPEDVMAKVEKMEKSARSHVRIRIHGMPGLTPPAKPAEPAEKPAKPAKPDTPPAPAKPSNAETARPVQPKGPMI